MKPDHLPEFLNGLQYAEISPQFSNGRWRYITKTGIRLPIKNVTESVIFYHDASGKIWARHDKFGLYIEPGYAWNGCSPKRWIWPLGWVGTIDFESTILASLCHDVHYQFARTEHFPLHRSDVDELFYHCIHMAGDKVIAGVYYRFVREFGTWAGRPKFGEFSTLLCAA